MNESAIDELLATIAIQQLKARYCRLVDTKQWAQLITLYTADARLDGFGSVPDGTDPPTFVAGVSKRLDPAITIHHVQCPEIQILGPAAARSIWPMMDYVDFDPRGDASGLAADRGWVGWGYYEEEYVRADDTWLISYMRLTRQRMDQLADGHHRAMFGRHSPSKNWL